MYITSETFCLTSLDCISNKQLSSMIKKLTVDTIHSASGVKSYSVFDTSSMNFLSLTTTADRLLCRQY